MKPSAPWRSFISKRPVNLLCL